MRKMANKYGTISGGTIASDDLDEQHVVEKWLLGLGSISPKGSEDATAKKGSEKGENKWQT